jgi:hypothetical protein
MDSHLHRIAREILAGGFDFDFIDTRDLIDSSSRGGRLHVGMESYATLIIPPGAVMCPKDLEAVERFVHNGGHVLALEPCSEFALPEIAQPPTGRDLGPGRSPAAVLTGLESSWPDRVGRFPVESRWIAFLGGCASGGVRIELDGTHLIARRSVHGGALLVLIANGSRDDASARVNLTLDRPAEVWDPWNGATIPADSNPVEITIPGYSALVVVAHSAFAPVSGP